MKIDRFEIDSWGTVKLRGEWKNGRQQETEYSNAPKSIILKLLSAKECPEMSDFDQWYRDWQAKKDQRNVPDYVTNWWTQG